MPDGMRARFFDPFTALDHPVSVFVAVLAAAVLVGFPMTALLLRRTGRLDAETAARAMSRWRAWLLMALCVAIPLILGTAWTMAAVALFSLACYGEFARVTGLFREKFISAVVVLSILIVTFAVFDHYDRLFFATAALGSGLVAIAALWGDRPQGYVQRLALGVLGFLLFGFSLGYLGNFANDANYRPILCMLVLAPVLSDVAGAAGGRLMKGPCLLPKTRPGWTVSGAVAALVITTLAVAAMGWFIFVDTPMGHPGHLLFLGFLVAALSQLGVFVVAAIKADVGVPGTGAILPGYGGLLDRFDSLVLIPPAVFHYLSLVLGPMWRAQPERIITGGL